MKKPRWTGAWGLSDRPNLPAPAERVKAQSKLSKLWEDAR